MRTTLAFLLLMMATAVGVGQPAQGGGPFPVPFNLDPTDESYLFFDEEFLNNRTVAGSIGTYGWISSLPATSGTVGSVSTTGGHPGLINISTSTTPGGSAIIMGDATGSVGVFTNLAVQVPWRFRMIFIVIATNGGAFEVGLSSVDTTATNASTTIIGVTYAHVASQNLMLVTGDGTTTSTAIVSPVATNVWYDILIQSVTAGSVYSQVNGGAFVTNSTHVPNSMVRPVARVALATGALVNGVTIDKFAGKFSMPTRYP